MKRRNLRERRIKTNHIKSQVLEVLVDLLLVEYTNDPSSREPTAYRYAEIHAAPLMRIGTVRPEIRRSAMSSSDMTLIREMIVWWCSVDRIASPKRTVDAIAHDYVFSRVSM
jgi:hypothetical protein